MYPFSTWYEVNEYTSLKFFFFFKSTCLSSWSDSYIHLSICVSVRLLKNFKPPQLNQNDLYFGTIAPIDETGPMMPDSIRVL